MHENDLTPSRGGRLLRPTRGAVAVVPAAIAVALVGRLIGSDWTTMAASALIGGLIGAAILTSSLGAATIARSMPERMRVGNPVTVRITVSNGRRLRALGPLLVTDRAPGLAEATVFVGRVRPGASIAADVVRAPSHRGRWADGGSVTVDARSPFGGFSRRRVWTWAGATVVHPGPARPLRPDARSSTSTSPAPDSSRAGRGSEVLGLRDWRRGDGASAVHWRSSARRGLLSVLEREVPSNDELIVALGRSGSGEVWELTVSCAAATAAVAFRRGARVTLVTGAGVSVPTSLTALLDWFADVESHPATTRVHVQQVIGSSQAPVVWLTTEDRS